MRAEEESEPLFEITHFRDGGRGVGFGIGFVLVFSGFGVFWKINHGFAGEHFALIFAGGEFLVFGGEIIFVFKLESFDFKFEEGFFALARGNFLGEGPVAGHGRDRAPSPHQAASRSDDNYDVIKNKQVMLQPILGFAKFGF